MANDKVAKKCLTRDGKVRVANHHTGDIMFPVVKTQGEIRIPHPPLIIPAGKVGHVDPEHWDELKKMVVVQHYLDRGLLGEVTKDTDVATDSTSTDLQIPEHLQNEVQVGNVATASVRGDKLKTGEVKVG